MFVYEIKSSHFLAKTALFRNNVTETEAKLFGVYTAQLVSS